MSGDVSRRGVIEGAAIAASAWAGMALATHARADVPEANKISHAAAKYQSTPKGQQRCEICLNFEPPDKCRIVQSPVVPTGWCQYFAARENAH